jgi:hypothetical protein
MKKGFSLRFLFKYCVGWTKDSHPIYIKYISIFCSIRKLTYISRQTEELPISSTSLSDNRENRSMRLSNLLHVKKPLDKLFVIFCSQETLNAYLIMRVILGDCVFYLVTGDSSPGR